MKKNQPKKINNRLQKYRDEAKAAMPDVKKLVAKYGRRAINSCMKKLHEYEVQLHELRALEVEVAKLRDAQD